MVSSFPNLRPLARVMAQSLMASSVAVRSTHGILLRVRILVGCLVVDVHSLDHESYSLA